MSADPTPIPASWTDTPTFGVIRGGIAGGFRWLSVALVVYAGSAGMASASVGLSLLAIDAVNRRDPVTGVFNVAAGVATLGAALLALAAFVLLLVGSSKLRPSSEVSLGTATPVFHRYHTALACSFALGTITAIAFAGSWFTRGRAQILGPVVLVLSGATAVAFLAAVLVPIHSLGATSQRVLFWIVAALSVSTIIGETVILLGSMSGNPSAITWITPGGFPLLNWHLVLGATIAGCSVYLARRYWNLAAVVAGHPRATYADLR